MRRNPLPTLLFYPVPIMSLAPFGLLFHQPPKLSLTKQKLAKRFRKIGATDSSQFDAANCEEILCQTIFEKAHFWGVPFEMLKHFFTLLNFFFYRSKKLNVYFLNFLVWANFINTFWRYFLPMLLRSRLLFYDKFAGIPLTPHDSSKGLHLTNIDHTIQAQVWNAQGTYNYHYEIWPLESMYIHVYIGM